MTNEPSTTSSTSMTRQMRRPAALAAVFGALVVWLLLAAWVPSASAHGGPFQLTATPDGAGGITVGAFYTADLHVVSEVIDPVVSAVSASGQKIDGVALVSSPEGEGVWVSAEPFLTDGDWAVTVTTTVPSSATVTVDMTVQPLAAPIEPGERIAAVDASGATPSPLPLLLWGAAVVVAIGMVGGIIVRRRREARVDH